VLPKVVGSHQGDGGRSEEAPVVQTAAAQHHAEEPDVVCGGRDQAAARALVAARYCRVEEAWPCPRRLGQRLGNAAALRLWQNKPGLVHAEGGKYELAQDGPEVPTDDDFRYAAKHLSGVAVMPDRPRWMIQRQGRKPRDELRERQILTQKALGPWSACVAGLSPR
jgi:hypothetical protein